MPKPANKKKIKVKSAPAKQQTRKELRKQKLEQKKQTKRLFFSSRTQGKEMVAAAKKEQHEQKTKKKPKKKAATKKVPIAPEDLDIEQLLAGGDIDSDESIDSDFSDAEVDARLPAAVKNKNQEPPAAKKAKVQTAARPDAAEAHRRELQRQKELEKAAVKQRRKQLVLENEEEDVMIARLEKKLKLNKTKDKNRLVRKMFNDGLDYALEFCLNDDEEQEKRELKERRKQELKQKEAAGWSDEDGDGGFGDEDDDLGEDDEGGSLDESDEESGADENEEDLGEQSAEEGQEPQFKEDIYGRKRDKDGNLKQEDATTPTPTLNSDIAQPQKYIPPHQRALLAAQGDDKQAVILERLRKNCKGLLNRLSEANLHKIAIGIEELYMRNSRYNMNETLTALLNEALIGRSIANERMVQEHIVLLAYLHAHVGSEIGAHFLQMFIEQYERFVTDISALSVDDKRLNNLVLVLAYLYIFKIYEHRLLLEIINRLSTNLCEKSIECMLLIFQSVGFKLRKDDPLAFKQMMLGVQRQIAEAPLELKENLRLKFMVDILSAVKNNNINKLPQFDPELAEQLRKRLKGMLRNDKYVITLNITMDDLLRADQVGKWWVVGSAWSGNINDVASAANQASTTDGNLGTAPHNKGGFSEKLLTLAKAQKMNTDERRNIFCIIMSAEDYVDAFEKILHLSLKDQRSIAYVIIHCSLNERRTNPYYAHLALKFCNYNRKFQLAFQFATWDRINEIESLSKQQIRNLAKFLQHLILNGGLVLSVLKVVDFLQLDKLSFLFMKEITVGLLLSEDESEVYAAFERVAKNPKLNQFKNSLRLFMQHFLLQQESAKLKLSEEQLVLVQKRVDYVDKILTYVDL